MREMSTEVVEERRNGQIAPAGLAVEHQSMAETGCAGSYRARLYRARLLEAVECPRGVHAVPVQGALQGCKPLEQNSVAATLETLHAFCLNLRGLTRVTRTQVAF